MDANQREYRFVISVYLRSFAVENFEGVKSVGLRNFQTPTGCSYASPGQRPELENTDAPKAPTGIAGTYNCHPVPVAAAISCLTKLKDPDRDVYGYLESLAQQLEEGQRRLFADHGITATIMRQGSAHCVYFMDRAPQNWWELLNGNDFEFDRNYRIGLIERGIYHFPVPTKQGSISYAHTRDDIDQTLHATEELLKAMN